MPEITITKLGSILRAQGISIKNARTQEFLSRNQEKQDTFHLPPGNHVLKIGFRFNPFQYPSSRFSINVPEGKHVYFDLKEKVIAHYLIALLSIFTILVIGAIIEFALKRNSIFMGNLVVSIPLLCYDQIKILTCLPQFKLLGNGYLELYHGWEY
ncbi:hypothetical protein [Aquirufa salirivi]|uniref:Uncharacterized protein n=1 Tax=Aquirufa salirivi TaxID=3104729 RepID=A0ABW8RV15_9BACT